jgi:hypothetical protein
VKLASTAVKTTIGVAAIAAAGVFTSATAAANPNIQNFGVPEQLFDGPMVTNYPVSNLQPSNVVIPGYTPMGSSGKRTSPPGLIAAPSPHLRLQCTGGQRPDVPGDRQEAHA